MDNINENLDLYYNPWTDLNFDQNNQQSVPDILPIEEDLLTEQEALQLTSLQNNNTEDMNSTQDPWEIFEETTIISGQAIGYNCDEESDTCRIDTFYTSDEETIYTPIAKNQRSSIYTINDLIQTRLNQVQKLLQLRINKCRLNKILWILSDIQFFLYPKLPTSLKDLNRDFMKLINIKKKLIQDRLVKQILKKLEKCKNLHFKGSITKHCSC
jgi:hypothetical protein